MPRRETAGLAECLEEPQPGVRAGGAASSSRHSAVAGAEGLLTEQGKPFLAQPCTCAIVPANNGERRERWS